MLSLLEGQKATKFPPGTKWAYSNSGYVVLGLIAAKVSGKSFPEFLQERIFVPLGMDHTLAHEKGENEVFNRHYGHTKEAAIVTFRSAKVAGWKQTIKVRPRRRLATAACTRRSRTWQNGMKRLPATRC